MTGFKSTTEVKSCVKAPDAPRSSTNRKRRRDQEEPPACRRRLFIDPQQFKEHLGRNWYFTTNTYNNTQYFHFREHEENESGTLIPTKKGIALIDRQFKMLVDCAPTIIETAKQVLDGGENEYSSHLGYGVYISIKKFNGYLYVDIRKHWKPDGCLNPVHTKKVQC